MYIFNLIACAFIAYVAIQSLIPIAFKIDLLDVPGGRKKHQQHTPLIGGLAMFFAFTLTCVMLDISLKPYRSLFAGAGILVFFGALDDLKELTARNRLLLQIFVAGMMTLWGHNELRFFSDFFSWTQVSLGVFGIGLTILGTISLINANNMLDGSDGIAGTLNLIQFGFLYYIARVEGDTNSTQVIGIIMMALCIFLLFNFPRKNKRAIIFMGDAGSMWLGYTLTWFCVFLSQPSHTGFNPATFVWIMAIPLMDLVSVFMRRIRKGQSPFLPDRTHFHHVLLDAGMSPRMTLMVIASTAIVFSMIGIALNDIDILGYLSCIIFIICFFIYNYLIHRAWQVKKFLRRYVVKS